MPDAAPSQSVYKLRSMPAGQKVSRPRRLSLREGSRYLRDGLLVNLACAPRRIVFSGRAKKPLRLNGCCGKGQSGHRIAACRPD